jgi:tetratricopeptide (TPR) repeat protein
MSCSASYYKELGIIYINKAIRLINPSPEYLSGVYQNLAQSYNGYYKYQEALGALLKAYELNSNDTLLIYKIGVQYDNWLKNKAMALKYYSDFVKICPQQNKSKPDENEEFSLTYYDVAIKRIAELKEEIKKEKE